MAIIKAIHSHASIGKAINYVTNEHKTNPDLIEGYNLDTYDPITDMRLTQKLYNKTTGRTYMHYVQSFAPEEKITPKEALQIAMETIEHSHLFDGFEVLAATHTDTDHVHTHIIVNSVSFENGRKYHQTKRELRDLKKTSDEICQEHCLTITQQGKTFTGKEREETSPWTHAAYRQLQKAEAGKADSYIWRIGAAVLDAKDQATNRQEFISFLEERNIAVRWTNRKYIVFVDLDSKAAGKTKYEVRDKRLNQYFNLDLSKETLTNEFKANARAREELEIRLERAKNNAERAESDRRKSEVERANRNATRKRHAAEKSAANAARKREEAERARRERERLEQERERYRGYDIEI